MCVQERECMKHPLCPVSGEKGGGETVLQLGPGTWPQNCEALGKSPKAMDISSCSPTHTVPEHRAVHNFRGFLSPLSPSTGPRTHHNSIAPNGLAPFRLQNQFRALITVFKPPMACPNRPSQPSLPTECFCLSVPLSNPNSPS